MKRSIFITFFQFVLLIILLRACSCTSYSVMDPTTAPHARRAVYNLYISSDFDENEVNIIQSSALEWQEKSNNIVMYNIYYNFDIAKESSIENKRQSVVFIKVSKYDERVTSYEKKLKGRLLGYCDSSTPTPTILIVYDRLLGREYTQAVVMHEIGHSLSLGHNEEENTLMYPSQDKSAKHITDKDLQEFCKVWHCDVKDLHN